MQPGAPRELVARLTGRALRHRTGLLFLPPRWLGREEDVAARLGTGYVSHRGILLRRLVPGQLYPGITWNDLVSQDLDSIALGLSPAGSCVLVSDLDVALSALRSTDRDDFWQWLREAYRPARALLLSLPRESYRVMPDGERARWFQIQRASVWDLQEDQ